LGAGAGAAADLNTQSASPAIRHVQFSPRDLVADAVDDYVTRMAGGDISVVSDVYYSVPPSVFGDGDGVRRLLCSILDNAGKLVRRGRIHVECRFENGFPDSVLVLTVRIARYGLRVNTSGRASGGHYFSVRIPVAPS
jgi:signal transduction histidine kinase